MDTRQGAPPGCCPGGRGSTRLDFGQLANISIGHAALTSSPARVIRRRRPWRMAPKRLARPQTHSEAAAWRRVTIARNGLERLQGGSAGYSYLPPVASTPMLRIGAVTFDLRPLPADEENGGALNPRSPWAVWCACASRVSIRRPRSEVVYVKRPGLAPDDVWRTKERRDDLLGHRGRRNDDPVAARLWQIKLASARAELKRTRKLLAELGIAIGHGEGSLAKVHRQMQTKSAPKGERNKFGMGERCSLEKWIERRLGSPSEELGMNGETDAGGAR